MPVVPSHVGRSLRSRSVRSVAALSLIGGTLGAVALAGPSPVGAAPDDVSGCVDWAAYDGVLGAAGTSQNQASGSSLVLPQILGSDVDMRITFVDAHALALLDPGASPDFDDIAGYRSALGGTASNAVFRYWPQSAQSGQVQLEFFDTGTTDRAEVEVGEIITGGVRKFPTSTWGVSEFALRSGGPVGSAVVPSWADPDASTIESDGPSNGITGQGSTPIVQLDRPNYGVAIDSAFNEARSSFVNIASVSPGTNGRDWTMLDWNGAAGDTILWDVYGAGTTTSAAPDPEATDPASPALPHTGLSSYIAGLCLTVPGDGPAPSYDLALAKVLRGYASDSALATYDITVRNQGSEPSGAFTVTDELPSGLSFVSASANGTASGQTVTWSIPVSDQLVAGASTTLTVTARVDDPTAAPFVNVAEISSDSGDDDDSTPDNDLSSDALVDITDPAVLANDSDATDDEDDHDVAELRLDHSIGNQVWLDTDNDGTIDASEAGICDVFIEVFLDENGDGVPDDLDGNGSLNAGDAIRSTATDCDGLWLVDSLASGRYIVGIPATEFAADGPLAGLASSVPTAANADGDVDNDDNCAVGSNGYHLTGGVALGSDEPIGESPNNATASLDSQSNLSIDCGFYRPAANPSGGGGGATAPVNPVIPRTGSETTGLAGLGLLMIAAGYGLVSWSWTTRKV